jgi:hypothetical protein
MGAWGYGIYDNDVAADWAPELIVHGIAAVHNALAAVVEAEYVEAPEGNCALCAADVVARLVLGGGEISAYCEDVITWVEANTGLPGPDLVVLALRSIDCVRGEGSELAELWAEDPRSFAEWSRTLSELEGRLRSVKD